MSTQTVFIHPELQKAANNPELQPHLAHVTQSAFGNRDMQGDYYNQAISQILTAWFLFQ